jgi:hypothetical protein
LAAISGTAFAYAAFKFGRGLPVALLGASFLSAVILGQWSPLLVAGVVVPWLGAVLVAKPTIGAALFAGYRNTSAMLAGAGFLAMSLVIAPDWVLGWTESLKVSNHHALILQPGGFLLLLASLRWRTSEGRLFMGLACVPQTIGAAETLPLFLIPRRRIEA